MKLFRKILFPFAFLYRMVMAIRNFLYDNNFYTSYQTNIPVIAVGNLSVGGTGKTPQIEYLIRLFSPTYTLATLSRGYKRKTQGFVLADINTTPEMIGDEPFQFFSKFKKIQVAVDADRKNGIEKLLHQPNSPELILLDDAYQHRKVKADCYVLLTAYGDLFTDDYVLPMGNLRESRSGANRSAVVVVTKCPLDLSDLEQQKITAKIQKYTRSEVFFSAITYDTNVYNQNENIEVNSLKNEDLVVLAGIAKPESFFTFFKEEKQTHIFLEYPDHHDFTASEINQLQTLSENKKIITTEKDYMRLKGKIANDKLYYLPIQISFLGKENQFQQIVEKWVTAKNL